MIGYKLFFGLKEREKEKRWKDTYRSGPTIYEVGKNVGSSSKTVSYHTTTLKTTASTAIASDRSRFPCLISLVSFFEWLYLYVVIYSGFDDVFVM